MALPQDPVPPDPQNKDAHAKLESDANRRKREARRWKELWVLDFKECYFFCAPHRQRQISSQTKPPVQRLLDAPELYTSLAFELTQDFVTEVVNTYMPEAQRWCERGPGMLINKEIWEKVKDDVRKDDESIFSAMKASNLYSEIQKSFYPDLAIGTCAMWIDKPHANSAINCSAITLRELEVNLGPFGEIDDRFAVRFTRNRYVQAILEQSGVDIKNLPKELTDDIEKNPEVQTEISFGFWRKWDRHDDEVWQHIVLVKDKLVHDAILIGEGSCPLLVPRFNPAADWPWGLGPMLQGLYDLRQVDELERQKIENVELHLTPPLTYPDDSFAAIEQGIEPGFAYPIRPGSEGAVKRIYDPPPPDVAIYQHEEMEKRLRRLFFVDFPQQSGDTPPTLGQWLDEMARAQRRIGTPGMSFWKEGPAKIFLRFKHLLEKAGTIKPVTVDGRVVSLQPYNPAQRAAEQQEIATATQYAQIMAQMFPEEWRMSIDGHDTMQKFAEKMRVTNLIGFRNDAQKKAFLQAVAPLIGARHEPGATPPAGAGPPAGV